MSKKNQAAVVSALPPISPMRSVRPDRAMDLCKALLSDLECLYPAPQKPEDLAAAIARAKVSALPYKRSAEFLANAYNRLLELRAEERTLQTAVTLDEPGARQALTKVRSKIADERSTLAVGSNALEPIYKNYVGDLMSMGGCLEDLRAHDILSGLHALAVTIREFLAAVSSHSVSSRRDELELDIFGLKRTTLPVPNVVRQWLQDDDDIASGKKPARRALAVVASTPSPPPAAVKVAAQSDGRATLGDVAQVIKDANRGSL